MIRWFLILLVAVGVAGGWWWWQGRGPEAPKYDTGRDRARRHHAGGHRHRHPESRAQRAGRQPDFRQHPEAVRGFQLAGEAGGDRRPTRSGRSTRRSCINARATSPNAKAATPSSRRSRRSARPNLLVQHAAPQAEVDTATATLHQAEATVQIKLANPRAGQSRSRPLLDLFADRWTVISRSVDVGQTVAAAMNAPVLFTVANDLTKMQIDSSVAEADVGNVEVGQKVDFTVDAFPFRTFHGEVVQVRMRRRTVAKRGHV